MKRILILSVAAMVGLCGSARAQFYSDVGALVAVTETQLGNLGYARTRGFGARAMGMGGAFIALSDDMTAASWNPAGLGQLYGIEVSAGLAYSQVDADQKVGLLGTWSSSGNGLYNDTEFLDPMDISVSDSETHLDYFGVAVPISFGLESRWSMALGLTYFANTVFDQSFDADINVNEVRFRIDSDQNFSDPISEGIFEIDPTKSTTKQLSSGDLSSYSLTAAFNFDDRFFLGVAFNYWDGTLDGSDLLHEEGGYTSFGGSATNLVVDRQRLTNLEMEGWSASLGLLFKPSGRWRIGAVYKPGYTLDTNGAIVTTTTVRKFEDIETNPQHYSTLFDGGEIDYPDSYGIGLAFKPKSRWTITADWSSTSWSGVVLRGQHCDGLAEDCQGSGVEDVYLPDRHGVRRVGGELSDPPSPGSILRGCVPECTRRRQPVADHRVDRGLWAVPEATVETRRCRCVRGRLPEHGGGRRLSAGPN